MDTTPILAVSGLRKSYRGERALDGVDFAVDRGEIFALLGPNGAGKTTTVNILATLVAPDAGTVTVNGFDLAASPGRIRRSLSLTGQFAAVDPFQTGAENLGMMARLCHLDRRTARTRIGELLRRFGLVEAAGRRAATYSGGMRRRLDLAISLLSDPPIVFLDEPTTGLDPRSRAQMWDIVRDLAAGGTTIVLTTQYLEEADQLADRVAVLDHGRIIATGTPASLKANLDGDRVELVFDGGETYTTATAADFGAGASFDPDRGSVAITTRDAVRTTRELLAVADAAGLAISTIDITRPTLDDVFLALTGEPASASGSASQSESQPTSPSTSSSKKEAA